MLRYVTNMLHPERKGPFWGGTPLGAKQEAQWELTLWQGICMLAASYCVVMQQPLLHSKVILLVLLLQQGPVHMP
jgi:hypothetical protein